MKKYIAVLTASLLLAACSESSEQPGQAASAPAASQAAAAPEVTDTAVTITNPAWPTYKIGTEANYPPFQYRNENGVPVGFEVDVLQAVANAAQFNTHIVHTSRKEWEQSLNRDQFAVWSSSFTISPERQQIATFSKPVITVENVVYVLDNEANRNIRTAQDLKGKRIAVSSYSKTAPEAVLKLTGQAAVPAKTFYLALKEMYSGKTDGVYGQDLVLIYYGLQNPEIKIRAINVGEQKKEIAFMVKKGNSDLAAKLNSGLDKIRADGTYAKLVQKWFGDQVNPQ